MKNEARRRGPATATRVFEQGRQFGQRHGNQLSAGPERLPAERVGLAQFAAADGQKLDILGFEIQSIREVLWIEGDSVHVGPVTATGKNPVLRRILVDAGGLVNRAGGIGIAARSARRTSRDAQSV